LCRPDHPPIPSSISPKIHRPAQPARRRYERPLRRQLAACTRLGSPIVPAGALITSDQTSVCATGSASANGARVRSQAAGTNDVGLPPPVPGGTPWMKGSSEKPLPRRLQPIAEHGPTLVTRERELMKAARLMVATDRCDMRHRTTLGTPMSYESRQPFALAQPVAHPPQASARLFWASMPRLIA
jgi:hypothetical protein